MSAPPPTLMVLDALADGSETVETMRDHFPAASADLDVFDQGKVHDAIRALLRDGSIVAREVAETDEGFRLVPVAAPALDAEALSGYWYEWTAVGERVWREGAGVLDAYWDAT